MLVATEMAIDGLEAMLAHVNAGSTLLIYEGSAPGSLSDPAGGVLLLEYTFGTPPFGTAIDADGYVQADASAIADVTAQADGIASFFRILNSADEPKMQGSVTGTGVGGDLEITSTSLVAGSKVLVSGLRARLSTGS